MELLPVTVAGLWLLGLVLLCVFRIPSRKLNIKRDNSPEPYRIPSILPYFGHLVGLIWHRNAYYTRLSAKYNEFPIYALPILNDQIYVINSPDLVLAAQRQPKIISFWQVEAIVTPALGALSTSATEKLEANVSQRRDERKPRGHGLLIEGLNATHRAMAPGQGFQEMLSAACETMAKNLNALPERFTAQEHVDLWQWVKHEVTHAMTECVYGPMNPYRDLAVENAFWDYKTKSVDRDFANDTMWLLSGPALSRVLARKGCEGRAKVVAAFLEYFSRGGHHFGSDLVKVRHKLLEHELEQSDIAGLECVNGQALLFNSVPTAFWTLWHVYSNREILDAIRTEVEAITSIREGWKIITLHNLKDLRILASTIHETLRHRSNGIGARIIVENTILDKYHLKKGSYVMFDNRSLHLHKPTWGSDNEAFDMCRFVQPTDQKRIQRSGAFRGFGGGANLCPGKDFATLEVMALVAMMVARFDMIPHDGRWSDPRQSLSDVSLAIPPPKSEVHVQIVERKGLEGMKWRFDDGTTGAPH